MESPVKKGRILGLVGWLIVVFIAASIGGAASVRAGSFYAELARPVWAPPSWLFGPVWTLLYLLMAIAAWLVWNRRNTVEVRGVLGLFLAQLVFNALWSWLFFGWHRGGWAMADILLLWVLLVPTILGFRRVRPLAGALLVPYLLWVSFAAALNLAVWRLNPRLLG